MTSLPDSKLLKVSEAVSSSEQDAPKFDVYSASKVESFTSSSPPVLEPSKDKSRTAGYRRLPIVEKIYTRSLRSSPSEAVPIVSSQSNDHDTEQQMNRQVEEGSENCCTIINCYQNSVTKFRNSAFIYIVQLLFSTIPVSAIIMGVLFAENCPKVNCLPVFGAAVGAMGAIFIAVWMFASCNYRRGTRCSNRQLFLLGMLGFALLIGTIVDAVFVGFLSPSFDPASIEYCNETFYTYAFYKEIATVIAIVLSAILYLPGSRHILCCHNL